MGYVLLPGETDAPEGLRAALRRSNRLQDILGPIPYVADRGFPGPYLAASVVHHLTAA